MVTAQAQDTTTVPAVEAVQDELTASGFVLPPPGADSATSAPNPVGLGQVPADSAPGPDGVIQRRWA
ncbi:hypothetical protein [Streptomyces cadmiisoli]|uniref:hypothetical protein n=1 Tax=Streptomyces cadmiisoli TaxID=2184053 RepID=UPI003659086E